MQHGDNIRQVHGHAALNSSSCLAPLQACMLPNLSACAIAALRASCQAMRHLVDQAPVEHLRSALQAVLPPTLPAYATSSLQLQAMVQAQADVAASLRAGSVVKAQPILVPSESTNFTAEWAPEWPATKLLLENYDYDSFPYSSLIEYVPTAPSLRESEAVDSMSSVSSAGLFSAVCFAKGGLLMASRATASDEMRQTVRRLGVWDSQHISCRSDDGCPSWQDDSKRYTLLRASTGLPIILLQEETLWLDTSTPGGIIAITLATLQEVYTIQPPDLLAVQPHKLESQAACTQMSPDDKFLAIMWCSHQAGRFTADAMRLDIYLVADGNCICTFDVRAVLAVEPSNDQEVSTRIDVSWFPNQTMLMVSAQLLGENKARVAILNIDGTHRRLQLDAEGSASAMSWSDDGMYVSLAANEGIGRVRGLLIDAQTGEVMFMWPGADTFMNSMLWAPSCVCFFNHACDLLVGLPSRGIRDSVVTQSVSGLRVSSDGVGRPNFAFSPDAKFLVAAYHSSSSQICGAAASSQIPGLSELAKGHRLCHVPVDCKLAHQPINFSMMTAATSQSKWQMGSIAWYPGPSTSHIYAIVNEGNQVHLIDAQQHCCLSTWSGPDLWAEDAFDVDSVVVCRLVWSPDGSQLLAAQNDNFNLLTFEQNASFGS